MDLDGIRYHELHPRKPDAVGRQSPPPGCSLWIGEVQHHLRARLGYVGQVCLLRYKVRPPFVDRAFITLRATYGDNRPRAQQLRSVSDAHNGGNAELPADDRGMRRPAAVVGHDGGGTLH
ncbi:hypothetical protein D9M72_478890 [compost metagenome]